MKEHRYVLGNLDTHHGTTGKRNCKAAITWSWDGTRFSMQAEIWLPGKQDISSGGQCVDYVAERFPDDAKAQRMLAIWKRYHLNDMRAGSPVQEQWLRDNPIAKTDYQYPKSHYAVAAQRLAEVGLNPDADGYRYGHAWKLEPLPKDVIEEIESWSKS